MEALRQIDDWPVAHAAAGVQFGGATHGRQERTWLGPDTRHFEWASVTKLATAVVALVAVEEGIVDLDEWAGPPGSTVRHLLAHASGLAPEPGPPIAAPGTRRVYSTYGFDLLGDLIAERAEMPFSRYAKEALWPYDCTINIYGSPGSEARGTIFDLLALADQLLDPHVVSQETLDEATAVAFPGLVGVLPGFGRMEPNDWGLGFELRDAKRPHWTGSRNSSRTFGHFGQTGTFLWVDPDARAALAVLTDTRFGDWAKDAWPRLSDAVLAELR